MRRIAPLPVIAGVCVSARLFGANLTPETIQAWDDYVKCAQSDMQQRLTPTARFLWIDQNPELLRKARAGEIVVAPVAHPEPHRIQNGLIHDWIGVAFLPDAGASAVMNLLRDYPKYKDFYKPYVIDSKTIALGTSEDRFSIIMRNQAVVLKTSIDGDYKSRTFQAGPHRWYTYSESTRLQEIEDFGTPQQHLVPEGKGGLLWRLFSISRFEERDGGVYIEVEAIALSRDIPFSLRWMIDPVVRRVSRSSLLTSLKQTGDAVREQSVVAHRSSQVSAR